MSVKFTGPQWNAFLADEWPEEWWIDGEEVWVNGILQEGEIEAKPTDVVKLSGGTIYPGYNTPRSRKSYEHYARKWLKKYTTVTLRVSIDKEMAEKLKQAIKLAGGKLL